MEKICSPLRSQSRFLNRMRLFLFSEEVLILIGLIVITLSSVNAVALFVVLKLSRNHAIERRDMLDRLMSRNLEEYKTLTVLPVQPSGPVDITEQEEYEREIEQMKSG